VKSDPLNIRVYYKSGTHQQICKNHWINTFIF